VCNLCAIRNIFQLAREDLLCLFAEELSSTSRNRRLEILTGHDPVGKLIPKTKRSGIIDASERRASYSCRRCLFDPSSSTRFAPAICWMLFLVRSTLRPWPCMLAANAPLIIAVSFPSPTLLVQIDLRRKQLHLDM
jgi:hypothetical protein